ASDSPYGPGWGTFMGLWWYVSGAVDDHVQAVNLVLSVLCVPALWAVVRRVAPPEGAAVAAALLAGLPLAVCLARSETMFVLVAALQLTAALGVVEPRRRGAWLAASSLVLLVLLRPYQVLVAGVLIAALWARGRAVPALVASVVLAWHAVDLLAVLQQPQVPTAAGFDKLDVLTSPWRLIGPDRALRLTDPWVTPIGAWLFVPFAWRVDRRAAWWLAALGLAAAAPYAIFARPTDALRFTLPAASWWCALVGMGLVGMPTRWRAAALAITALSFVPARRPVPEPYAWTLEHAHLVAVLPSIPAREVVTYDPTFDEHGTFETWIQLRGHGVWHPGTLDDTAPGGLHWLGRFEGATILPPCAEPVDLVEIDGPSTNVEPDFGPVLVGLVRRVACGGDAAALPLDEGRHP
ncbi:MAG: glycosyltransferase family 39 protein, partial [Alphaproteobacteria bacterium]|nr:glycosyltransferase family 39 protein [Alphaproteobacteria bacterium]